MFNEVFCNSDSPWIVMSNTNWEKLTEGFIPFSYNKKHVFYEEKDYSNRVFIVHSGRVAMCLSAPSGDLRQLAILDKGCIFGNQTLIDHHPCSCRAIAVSDKVEVYEIPIEIAAERLNRNPELLFNLLVQSNRLNRMLITQVSLMSFQNSEARVVFMLVKMLEQYSLIRAERKKIEIKFTHQDIADVTGLSRVSVSNVFSNLTREGIICKEEGVYYIVKPDLLKAKIDNQ